MGLRVNDDRRLRDRARDAAPIALDDEAAAGGLCDVHDSPVGWPGGVRPRARCGEGVERSPAKLPRRQSVNGRGASGSLLALEDEVERFAREDPGAGEPSGRVRDSLVGAHQGDV
jgi:hypothetical protein